MSIIVDIFKGAVDFVVDVVESVGKVVVKTVETIVNVISDTVSAIVNLAEDVFDVAGTLIENYAVQAAFVAMGIPPVYAAPLTASTTTLVRGGSFSDAIKAGAVSIATTKVSNTVFSQARAAGFSVTQATAAASAASSAAATAAYGGDLKDILKSAAIGGISSTAASEVMASTDNKFLANFTRTATSAALRGQKLDQAILMGASASAVQYLDEYIELANAQDKLMDEYKKEITAYTRAVNRYNGAVESYNANIDAAMYWAEQGPQYQSIVDTYLNAAQAIADELPTLEANYDAARKSFLPFDRQLRNLQRPMEDLLEKAAQELGEEITDWEVPIDEELKAAEQSLVEQIQQIAARPELTTIGGTEIAASEPIEITGVRPMLYADNNVIIFQGADGEPGESLNRQTGEIYKYTPQEYEALVENLRAEGFMGEGGVSRFPGVGMPTETATGFGLQTASSLDELGVQKDIVTSQVTGIDNAIGSIEEQIRAYEGRQNELDRNAREVQSILDSATTQATANEANAVLRQIQDQKNQTASLISDAQAQITGLETERQNLEGQLGTLSQNEQQLINQERESLFAAAFDEAISQLEREVAEAKSQEEATQAQARFVQEQRDRLREQGRLRPTTGETLEGEISRILDEYEQAQQTGASAGERLSQLRPSEEGAVGAPVTDAEVIEYLGLSPEQVARYGFTGGTTEGGAPEGGAEGGPAGGAEGDGTGAGGEGTGAGGEPAPITEVPQPPESGVGAFTPIVPQQEERTQGISGRVTGQSLVGILGDKEPTFGGDPGQQQEVWNIRSLRLRRALGL